MNNENETFPILKTERLDLIELDYHHAADLFRMFTDERITGHYLVFPFKAENDLYAVIESFRMRYRANMGIRWGIALSGHKEIIGTIGYHHYTKGHKGTVVFAIMPEHQNKGYASEALRAIMQFGFESLNLQRIDAEVMPGNVASDYLLTKAGFAHEGLLRKWLLWEGELYDVNMYARIAENITP